MIAKKKLFLIIIALAIFLPVVSLAVECNGTDNGLNLCYPKFGPGNGLTLTLNNLKMNEVVAWFYYAIIGISGLAAFVMLVWGGFKYLTATVNPTGANEAKDIIKNALLGLLLILASYLILQVINPDLTILREPVLQTLPRQ